MYRPQLTLSVKFSKIEVKLYYQEILGMQSLVLISCALLAN